MNVMTQIHPFLDGKPKRKPPFRQALGRGAVERIRQEMETQRGDLDTWADVAIGADYPGQA